jgi:hypothetical protein
MEDQIHSYTGKFIKGHVLKSIIYNGKPHIFVTVTDSLMRNNGVECANGKNEINGKEWHYFAIIECLSMCAMYGNFDDDEDIFIDECFYYTKRMVLSEKILFTDMPIPLCIDLMNYDGSMIEFMSDEMKDNYDVCMAAATNWGASIDNMSENMKNNHDICMAAIEQDPLNVMFIGNTAAKNIQFYIEAVNRMYYVMAYIPEEIKSNLEFCKAVVAHNKRTLKYLSEELQHQMGS